MSDPLPTSSVSARIETRTVREMRRLVQFASSRVHSDPRMRVDDKKPILAALAKARKMCDDVIQLELFSPAQREE